MGAGVHETPTRLAQLDHDNVGTDDAYQLAHLRRARLGDVGRAEEVDDAPTGMARAPGRVDATVIRTLEGVRRGRERQIVGSSDRTGDRRVEFTLGARIHDAGHRRRAFAGGAPDGVPSES